MGFVVSLLCSFVKLLDSISHTRKDVHNSLPSSASLNLVKQWIQMLKQCRPYIPINTCKIFLRLFFPEEDIRRRYNIQETTLAKSFVKIFSLSVDEDAGKRLINWSNGECRTNLGCLGIEIERALLLRHSVIFPRI